MRIALKTRQQTAILLSFAGCLMFNGCHRRMAVPTLPPVLTAPAVPPPTPAAPSMKGSLPSSVTRAPSVKVTEVKPVRRAKRSTQKSSQQPVAPVATEAVVTPPVLPASSVLGALTTGGEASPQAQQETAVLIATGERRLQAVSETKARDQLTQLKEVRHFLDQAKEALSSGDAEGAKTLATKAKLLIDDLEKWAAK